MKKVKKAKPFSKKYRPVVMYLDALQEIFDTMKAISEKVELSSDDYKFDSLDDAKEHFGSRPQFVFTFSSSVPYAQVEFSRMEAEVYVSAGDKSAQLAPLAQRARHAHTCDGIVEVLNVDFEEEVVV